MLHKLAGALSLLLATVAWASVDSIVERESFTLMGIESRDELNDVDNVHESISPVGGYTVTAIQVTGTLSDGSTGTWASEVRIEFTPAAAPTFLSGSMTGTLGYSGTAPVGPTLLDVAAFDPAGSMDLEFYESLSDVPNGVDQTWDDITIAFVERSVTNESFSIGTLPSDGTMVVSNDHSHVSGGLDFFEFSLDGTGSWLNLQTYDPMTGDSMDTEIAVFDSAGLFIAFNDNGQESSQGGLYSLLSFGVDDPLSGADVAPGANGPVLTAGDYTLVTGGHDTNFSDLTVGVSTLGDVVPGTSSGAYDVKMTYGVPEPCSLLLDVMALIGIGVIVRKYRA